MGNVNSAVAATDSGSFGPKPRYFTYIIGRLGSGKSTLARALTDGIRTTEHKIPHIKWTEYGYGRAIQLGHDRKYNSGVDTLHFTAMNHVIKWLEKECPYRYILGEGERLGNNNFFTAVTEMGYTLRVYYLQVDKAIADDRYEKRWREIQEMIGSGQIQKVTAKGKGKKSVRFDKEWDMSKPRSESFVRGRNERVERLREKWVADDRVLNGNMPAKVIANMPALTSDPVVKVLRQSRYE